MAYYTYGSHLAGAAVRERRELYRCHSIESITSAVQLTCRDGYEHSAVS